MKSIIVVLLAALASAATVATAQPARGGASDCVWAATPAGIRSELSTRFGANSLNLGEVVTSALAVRIAQGCHLPPTRDSADLMADTMWAHTAMDYGLAGLKARGIPVSRLDEVWNALGPESREVFSHAFSPGFKPSNAVFDDLAKAAHKPDLQGDELSALIFDYVTGRAVLERIR
jgi:hypothetical protein